MVSLSSSSFSSPPSTVLEAQVCAALDESSRQPARLVNHPDVLSGSHFIDEECSEEPELPAVLVVQQGYHLYHPPTVTFAYSEGATDEHQETTQDGSRLGQASDATHFLRCISDSNVQSEAQQYVTFPQAVREMEEEKEEIVDSFTEYFDQGASMAASQTANVTLADDLHNPLAGMPIYDVGTYNALPTQATVLGGSLHSLSATSAAPAQKPSVSEEESELAAFKRAAAYGITSQQRPEPRPTEDLDIFYSRTCELWNAIALDAQSQLSEEIDIERVMDESFTLAREHFAFLRQLEQVHSPTQEATVVEIADEYLHPAEILNDGTVRAEIVGGDYDLDQQPATEAISTSASQAGFVGQQYADRDYPTAEQQFSNHSSSADSDDNGGRTTPLPPSHCSEGGLQAMEVHDSPFDQAAEATVIDSSPVNKTEGHMLWRNTEEVQVLQHHGSTSSIDQALMDRKPAAVDRCDTGSSGGTAPAPVDFAVADQEAEVVGIEDDIHPSEFIGSDAEAELVGTDFAYAAGEDAEAVAVVHGATEPQATEAVVSLVSDESYRSPQPDSSRAIYVSPEPLTSRITLSAEAFYSPGPAEVDDAQNGDELLAVIVEQTSGLGVENSNSANNNIPTTASIISPVQDGIPTATFDKPSSTIKLASNNPGSSRPASDSSLDRDRMRTNIMNHGSFCSGMSDSFRDGDCSQMQQRQREETEVELPDDSVATRHVQTPSRQDFGDSDWQTSTSSNTSQRSQLQIVSDHASRMTASLARSTGNVMETLFGETRHPLSRRGRVDANDAARCSLPRTLLPWSVIRSTRNDTWVATLQINQKALDGKNVKEASKSLRAYSLSTEAQAICFAKAWAPPRMLPFQDNPCCHICSRKFAVFRRPCHCRNCGVCICKDCVVQWPAKMIPETYNIKKENMVYACKSCEWLCNQFRLSLLEGKMDEAVAVHATGNVNLTCPFANVKGEEFYPVHCAVLGGNLQLLRWLVDENCCPIKSIRIAGKFAKDLSTVVTSRGRSLLGIAMENESVEIVRYLVVNKGLSVMGEKDISTGMLVKNLEKILRLMPDPTVNSDTVSNSANPPESPAYIPRELPLRTVPHESDASMGMDDTWDMGMGDSRIWGYEERNGDNHDEDECIICFDGKIDCVATPCGHQMCCQRCSKNISRCPVCAQNCSFLRVFKP